MQSTITAKQFVSDWNGRLSPEGVYLSDPRFKLVFITTLHGDSPPLDRGYIKVTLDDDTDSFVAVTSQEILSWMVTQRPPPGSMRLGNVVSRLTQSIGIKPCQACKHRQLALNRK